MRMKAMGLLLAAVMGGTAVAAGHGNMVTRRIWDKRDGYVYVAADVSRGVGGYAPDTRESVKAAVNAGADIVILSVSCGADGKVMAGEGFPLDEAARMVRDRALVTITGYEAFPAVAVGVLQKTLGTLANAMLLTTNTFASVRVRKMGEGGLTDQVIHQNYDRNFLIVPAISLDRPDLAIFPPLMPLLAVSAKDPASVGRLAGIVEKRSSTLVMFDTTSDDTAAGHGDAKAVLDPEANWGWCLARGATAIRTTRPAELVAYLNGLGHHRFYNDAPVVPPRATAGSEVRLAPVLVPAPREMLELGGVVPATVKVTETRGASLPPEGYALEIAVDGIRLAAADDDGAFWARRTLAQLKGVVNGAEAYPAVRIRDWPAYRWRGALLDDSRHFIGKAGVKEFIAAMSLHKLNRFHWHITDDQGCRVPLDGFPELREYASAVQSGGVPYGPFCYTPEDIAEIVSFAKSNRVEIVPEFEMPGHARAIVCAYPELACETSRPKRGLAMNKPTWCAEAEQNCICAGDDAAIELFGRMLDAFCDRFPESKTIHIGGDEVYMEYWKKCPKCQARIKALGLKDEHQLQSWLTRQFTERLARRGRKTMAWDEVVTGGLPNKDIQVMCWTARGMTDQVATSNGNQVVVCWSMACYFDKDQSIPDDPHPSFARVTLEQAYAYDPCRRIDADHRKYVMGTEGLLWSEYIRDAQELIWKAYPRLCATAEISWTDPPKPRDFAGFQARLGTHIPRLRALGVGSAHTQEIVPPRRPRMRRAIASDLRPLKVLMIGDEFSESVMRSLPALAKAEGRRLDIVQMSIGGCSLQQHWENFEKGLADPSFAPYRITASYGGVGGVGNIPALLRADRWDVVTLQQASGLGWRYETYEPYLGRLVERIRELAPQAEIRLQQTWAGDRQGTVSRVCGWAADAYGLRQIPVGDAIGHFYGKTPAGESAAKPVCDAAHLGPADAFIQGLVWYGTLFNVSPREVKFVPEEIDRETAKWMRLSAAVTLGFR